MSYKMRYHRKFVKSCVSVCYRFRPLRLHCVFQFVLPNRTHVESRFLPKGFPLLTSPSLPALSSLSRELQLNMIRCLQSVAIKGKLEVSWRITRPLGRGPGGTGTGSIVRESGSWQVDRMPVLQKQETSPHCRRWGIAAQSDYRIRQPATLFCE